MTGYEWQTYETPYIIDRRADFAWMSNEDLGVTITFATGVNDTEEYAFPYPSSIDLFEETTVLYKMDTMLLVEQTTDILATEIVELLNFYSSMLQVEFNATFQGTATDAEDEALKTTFAGPMTVGRADFVYTLAAAPAQSVAMPKQIAVAQYMPFSAGIDLITPIYYKLYNNSYSVSNAFVLAAADFANPETFAQRMWHRKRSLTSQERSFRNISIRFQLIDT